MKAIAATVAAGGLQIECTHKRLPAAPALGFTRDRARDDGVVASRAVPDCDSMLGTCRSAWASPIAGRLIDSSWMESLPQRVARLQDLRDRSLR